MTEQDLIDAGYKIYIDSLKDKGYKVYQRSYCKWFFGKGLSIAFDLWDFSEVGGAFGIEGFSQMVSGESETFNVEFLSANAYPLGQVEQFFCDIYEHMNCIPYGDR